MGLAVLYVVAFVYVLGAAILIVDRQGQDTYVPGMPWSEKLLTIVAWPFWLALSFFDRDPEA